MIAPLDIHGMMVHKRIQDQVWAWSPVINITHHMQMIDDHTADQVCTCHDHLSCPACRDDRMDDLIVISLLFCLIRSAAHQLLDHIGKIRRHCFSYLGTRVLGCRTPAEQDHTVDGHLIPFLDVLFLGLHLL